MRNQWYGDHRDVIKWGTLLKLARDHQLRFILQVAYLRPDASVPTIVSDLDEAPVAQEALRHFRDIRQISSLATLAGLEIEILDVPFEPKFRKEYTDRVLKRVRATRRDGWVVFLDPDTGLKDAQSSPSHVTPDEIRRIWDASQLQDCLVLYQHASREADWVQKRREIFAAACPGSTVIQFRSREGSRDVVFFAASRATDLSSLK
jgi:hypothetical protein